MVMCGEQRTCSAAPVVVQVFNDCTRNCEPIIGACTAPDFVQDDKAARCGMMQDGSRLNHLYHKGALARSHVILRSNTCENTIYQPHPASFIPDVTPDPSPPPAPSTLP